MAISYKQKLNDDRWQQRRKTILARDSHTCRSCGSTSQLHVHHLKYTGEPWEAPDEDLLTLCRACHNEAHQYRKSIINLGPYTLVSDTARLRAARETREAAATLDAICSFVEKENFVRIRPTKLAKALGLSVPTVERHLAKLKSLKLLEADPLESDKKIGILCWRVCPYLSWKGSNESLDRYMKALPKEHYWLTYNTEQEQQQ